MIAVAVHRTASANLSGRVLRRAAALAAAFEKCLNGDVEVIAAGERAMRQLNRQWRGLDRPTDVLSFAWREEPGISKNFLGQVYLCPPVLRRQARRFGVSVKEETVRMFVHGLLHLAGHDHIKQRAADKMFALQEKIVTRALAPRSRLRV